MNVGAFLKTTKGKIISIGGGTALAVGIGAAVLLQGEGFRSISVEQVTGTVSIVGEKNNGQAYVGEHLYSGDDVTVGDASELTMCMDDDKYVYADANTHFVLEASAAKEDSRIKIYLDAGSELNELNSSLAEGETYEVDTPNSTMAVRGTKFRVTVYKAKDGLIYTLMEVTEGEVCVRLKTTDGTYNGVERVFTPGQSALIRGNSDFSEFVTSDMLDNADLSDLMEEDTVLMLAYDSLPKDGLKRLIALLEDGGIIEKEDAPKDVVKAEVTPTPMPTPSPFPTLTPTPTPLPKLTGPTQEELLMQLLASITPTPSPVPEYIPTDDDDSEDSDSGSSSVPAVTPPPVNTLTNGASGTLSGDTVGSTYTITDANGNTVYTGELTESELYWAYYNTNPPQHHMYETITINSAMSDTVYLPLTVDYPNGNSITVSDKDDLHYVDWTNSTADPIRLIEANGNIVTRDRANGIYTYTDSNGNNLFTSVQAPTTDDEFLREFQEYTIP